VDIRRIVASVEFRTFIRRRKFAFDRAARLAAIPAGENPANRDAMG
jgi:hypothetical protein